MKPSRLKTRLTRSALVALPLAVALGGGLRVAGVCGPATPHAFRLDRLRDPLSVVSIVQERDGGSLVVRLADPAGRRDAALFNYNHAEQRRPHSAWSRLYVDDWLVPLGSPQQERIVRAIRRYVAGLGPTTGGDRPLAQLLLEAVDRLERQSRGGG